MSRLKVVIFDFDGVLGNTYDLNFQVVKEIDPSASEQDFIDFHRGSVFEDSKIKFKPGDELVFVQRQRQLFEPHHLFEIDDLLADLSHDYRLYIVSSSSEDNIRKFLQLRDLDRYFDQILGFLAHPSKVKKFQMILDQTGITVEECVFITDTTGDLVEAAVLNLPSIAVSWGFHDRQSLLVHQPLAVVDSIEELRQSISTLS